MVEQRAGAGRWRSVGAVVVVAAGLVVTGARTAGPPRCDRLGTMVALEVAGRAGPAEHLRAEWQEMSGLPPDAFARALRHALLWDCAFLVFYTLAIVLACLALRRSARAAGWRRAGAVAGGACLLAVVAALSDALENLALWRGLAAPGTDTWPALARACAFTKFGLVVLVVAFVLALTIALLTRRTREDPGTWSLPLVYAAPLGTWTLSYPVLLGVTVLLLGVVWRVLLSGLGIPDLFWHELRWHQFLAGVGTGLLSADLGLTGFLLDAPSPWMSRLATAGGFPRRAEPTVRALVRYLLLTSGVIAVLALASVLRAGVSPAFLFPFGVVAGACAFGGLVVLTWSRSAWPRRVMALLPLAVARRARLMRAAGVGDEALDGLAAVVMVVRLVMLATMVALAASGGTAMTVPPGFAICLILGTAVSLYGLFVFFFPLHRFGLVAGATLVLAAISGVGGPIHRIREMSYTLEKPRPGDAIPVGLEASGLADDEAVLKGWLSTYGPRGPLVVVAVDGGGVRAATWAMTVLTQLEEDFGRGFPSQVRVVTGASGGMQAAAYYVGSLGAVPGGADPLHLDGEGNGIGGEALRQDVSRDSLTPLTKRLLLHDLFPWLGERAPDRGDAIQEAWYESTRGVFRATLRSLQAGEAAGWRPSLILSPMVVEDGRRLLISNLDLDALATQAKPGQDPARGAIEFARLFPDAGNLRLGTAVRMSATFPYVMPAIELPTAPPLRVVDAGYYDNHGVALAAAWLLRHSVLIRDRDVQRVILIEVPGALASVKKAAPCNDRRPLLVTGFSELTTPVEGIFSGRDAVSAYGNDELIEIVGGALNTPARPDRFVTVSFEPPYGRTACGRCARPEDEVPLSWSISARDRDRLLSGMQAEASRRARETLRGFWKPALPGAAPPH